MTEPALLDAWIHARLSADPTITAAVGPNIYSGVAPAVLDDGGTLPGAHVVFQLLDAVDTSALMSAHRRLLVRATVVVKAVLAATGPVGSYLPIVPVAAAIDALLEQPADVPDGVVGACHRTAPVHYPEIANDRLWWHVGGTYLIDLTPQET